MQSILENYVLPVVCPHCGARIQKTVKWFRENHQMDCPCGTTIYLATDELIPSVDALESVLTHLVRPAPATAER